ncbi:hypothetical protein FPV67DRAFT_1471544 [Lyophyllum atratum]|nr:hypothetical protein FPV67DRAFT_1471544 [Lyophyllum atratum]
MAEKKKSAQTKSKVKPSATKQRTLFDLFPKKADDVLNAPEVPDVRPEAPNELNYVVDVPSSPCAPESDEICTAAVVEKMRQASLEPRPIHPFFAKSTPSMPQSHTPPEQLIIRESAVIEVIDDESTNNLSSENLTDSVLLVEGGSQEDPIVLDSSPLKAIRPRNAGPSKPLAPFFTPRLPKAPAAVTVTPRSPGADGLIAPYPGQTSQHVYGQRHSFSSPALPYGRRARRGAPSFTETPDEASELFLRNLNESRIYTSISPQYIPSITAGDSYLSTIPDEDLRHPAIARFETQPIPSSSTHRMWVDKWHPTRAAEVLGNEENALYLRDWLRALELHLSTDTTSECKENSGGKGKAKADARGTKRPRVVRAVEKRRGRKKRKIESDGEDDWIVNSDALEAEEDRINSDAPETSFDRWRSSPPSDDSNAYQPSSPAPTPKQEVFPHRSFDPLTNTILLSGPSGAGKTAAVYACAEELGWEVFEVYPGIGKRSGHGIDTLIGDVGKNHLVRKTRTGDAGISKGRIALTQLFKGTSGETPAQQPIDDIENAHPPPEDFGFISPYSADVTEAAPVVRQSLILLEEVDILFQDDNGFWPAVTKFIKDCRRPVVCTCNDISLVPTQDLPLQAVLYFQPCPPPLAASYLQGLSSAEGYVLERNSLLQLYGGSAPRLDSLDVPDSPTPPTSGDFPAPDLRRAINCLQFQCSSADSEIEYTLGWEPAADIIEDLCDWNWSIEQGPRKSPDGPSADQGPLATVMRTEAPPRSLLAARHADLISFVDSHLMRRAWDTSEALAWSNCEPSNEDEISHRVLFCPRITEGSFGLRDHDEEIASTAMCLSREALQVGRTQKPTSSSISPIRTRELFRARVDHQLQMAEALGGIVPLSVLKMRRAEVRMDYETSIRDIVAAEDMEELLNQQKYRFGRMTRNSGGGFVRTIVLTTESRAALTETVLRQI